MLLNVSVKGKGERRCEQKDFDIWSANRLRESHHSQTWVYAANLHFINLQAAT